MMTSVVLLSLLTCSPDNKLAEGRRCLRAVQCVCVIFINVNRHLVGVSDGAPSPSGLRAPLIPLLRFELPSPRQGHMMAEQETDIYKQAKGHMTKPLTPTLAPAAPV